MLPERKPITERIAGWSVRHRILAVCGWFVLVVVAVPAGGVLGLEQTHSTDPGESGRVDRVLDAQTAYVPLQENVLVQSRTGTARFADDPELRSATRDLTRTLRGLGTLRSPLDRDGADLISGDGRSGLVNIRIAGPDDAFGEHYDAIVKGIGNVAARHPQVRLAQAGDKSLSDAVDGGIKDDVKRAEYFSCRSP